MTDKKIHIRIFSSGYCTGNNSHIHRGEKREKLTFPAIWIFIEHPHLGSILFDTGYSKRFMEATRRFPEIVYKWMTPVTITGEDECVRQLQDLGIAPSSVDHVVISHFHADHIGGLKDFNSSKLWCQQAGLDLIRNSGRLKGVAKAQIKSLVPDDIHQRVLFPEVEFPRVEFPGVEFPEETKEGFRCWKWNKNIWFVDLPGHARGHLGLYIKGSNLGDVLFIGDATWTAHGYRENVYPPRMVSLIADGYHKLTATMDMIHQFHLANRDVLIIPSHCKETLMKIQSN